MTRFIIGFFVMTGALVFLGCPLRMILRLAAGDFNAILALWASLPVSGWAYIYTQRFFTWEKL